MKMFAWEPAYLKRAAGVREREMALVRWERRDVCMCVCMFVCVCVAFGNFLDFLLSLLLFCLLCELFVSSFSI